MAVLLYMANGIGQWYLLDQEPDNHHVVYSPFLAGVVGQDWHEGKQQTHQAILKDKGSDGDLPMRHVCGAAVFETLHNYGC